MESSAGGSAHDRTLDKIQFFFKAEEGSIDFGNTLWCVSLSYYCARDVCMFAASEDHLYSYTHTSQISTQGEACTKGSYYHLYTGHQS